VRFVVDENLSPRLCQYLTAAGDTAEHIYRLLGGGASDHEVFACAIRQGAVIVTADTDFGALLAEQGTAKPSVVLVRELLSMSVTEQGRLLAENLSQLREPLANGAIVVFSRTGIRVRPLPLNKSQSAG